MNIGQWGHLEKKGSDYVRTSAYGPYARFWDRKTGYRARIRRLENSLLSIWLRETLRGDPFWGPSKRWRLIGVHNTGTLNLGGSIATAGGLVFIGGDQ